MEKANFWDRLGESINSLGAVLLPMGVLITGGMFLSHTYFKQILPGSMDFWESFLAAWMIAVAWELTVLVTTVNQRHVKKWIPRCMAICSGIIFLFYINAFDESLGSFARIQKIFVGALVSFVSYTYVELFHAKWLERTSSRSIPSKLDEAGSALVQAESKLVQTESALVQVQSKLVQAESKLDGSQSALIQIQRKLDEAEAFRLQVLAGLTCPHCIQQFETYGSLQAHKGHCAQNPKKKQKSTNLNGYGKHTSKNLSPGS